MAARSQGRLAHSRRKLPRTGQRGFTLVEMALGLGLLAMLAALAFQSQGVVQQYRQHQFVTQVRVLQSALVSHRQQQGRWPGDCNRDGILDHELSSNDTVDGLDYAVPTQFSAATDTSTAYTLGTVCPASTLDPYDDLNVVFNELKRGGQTAAGAPNRIAAGHAFGGMSFMGHFNTSLTNPNTFEEQFNAIVLTGVPIASARQLAAAIDGYDGSAANLNRVRRSDDLQTFKALWTAVGETDDKRITVVVFFDRVPPVTL